MRSTAQREALQRTRDQRITNLLAHRARRREAYEARMGETRTECKICHRSFPNTGAYFYEYTGRGKLYRETRCKKCANKRRASYHQKPTGRSSMEQARRDGRRARWTLAWRQRNPIAAKLSSLRCAARRVKNPTRDRAHYHANKRFPECLTCERCGAAGKTLLYFPFGYLLDDRDPRLQEVQR